MIALYIYILIKIPYSDVSGFKSLKLTVFSDLTFFAGEDELDF